MALLIIEIQEKIAATTSNSRIIQNRDIVHKGAIENLFCNLSFDDEGFVKFESNSIELHREE